jgi:hypothetical protein
VCGSTRASLAWSDGVLVFTEKAEVVRQHSDDRNRLLVKDEFLADYTGITIEVALPETERHSLQRFHRLPLIPNNYNNVGNLLFARQQHNMHASDRVLTQF